MNSFFFQNLSGRTKKMLCYTAFSFLISVAVSGTFYMQGKQSHPFLHVVYYFFIAMTVFLILNPKSMLYELKVSRNRVTFLSAAAVILFISLLCVIPMGVNPIWNGEKPDHRNQYEELADALLEGHLYVHPEDDTSALSAMENPYDAQARAEQGIPCSWDHAFYDGHYYVYFGVVPAVVLFLPYRLLSGEVLTTWKATAVFSVFIILAIFLLGYKMIRKIGADIPIVVYCVLSSCLSLMTLWCAVKYPAMYCTAIVSGICFMLWSLYFIIDAFYIREEPALWEIFAGALCGALVFGCRPPIGFAEIILLPFLISSLKKQHAAKSKKILQEAAAFLIPYIIVAILLMLYNYMRFENPFEFGQSYQITVTDQSAYLKNIGERISLPEWINWCGNFLFGFSNLSPRFPWVTENLGLLVMFPILFLGFPQWHAKKDTCMKWFHITLLLSVGIIIENQSLSVPEINIRYLMDFTFLLCLSVLFKVIHAWQYNGKNISAARTYSLFINYTALLAIAVAFLQFFTGGDSALADVNPELVNRLSRFFVLHDIV